MARRLPALVALAAGAGCALLLNAQEPPRPVAAPPLEIPAMWEYTAPLISPEKRVHEHSVAQKDPSVVYNQDNWHGFMTVKLEGRTVMEYCSFAKVGPELRALPVAHRHVDSGPAIAALTLRASALRDTRLMQLPSIPYCIMA